MVEQTEIERSLALFQQHIPVSSVITIQETDQRLIPRYLVRITYTSLRSGRKITLTAKGNEIPLEPGTTLTYYLTQLVMTPSEVGREFSRIYFLEHRSRQDEFLFSKNNIRVSKKDELQDKLTFKEYA